MIYLVRHGLDDERFVGGYSDVGLINEGIMQIESVGQWLLDSNIQIKKIYSSDILRAVESANIISQYLDINIIVDSRLREQDKGLLNGMEKTLATSLYCEFLRTNDVTLSYPGGESLKDLYIRIKNMLSILSDYDDSLLVTHRGVINMFYYLFNGDSLDMQKGKYDVTHGSVHQLDINRSKIRRIR